MGLTQGVRVAYITVNLSYQQFVFITQKYGGGNRMIVSDECMYTHTLLSDHFTTKKGKKITEICYFLLFITDYGPVGFLQQFRNADCSFHKYHI